MSGAVAADGDARPMSVEMPHHDRGAGLLLAHCAVVADERPSAVRRGSRQQLGGDLARLLVVALAGPQGRRGSSSP